MGATPGLKNPGCADRWVIEWSCTSTRNIEKLELWCFHWDEMSEKLMNWINWCVFFWHFYIHGYCRRLEGIQDTPESPARRWHGLCQSGRSEVSKGDDLEKTYFYPDETLIQRKMSWNFMKNKWNIMKWIFIYDIYESWYVKRLWGRILVATVFLNNIYRIHLRHCHQMWIDWHSSPAYRCCLCRVLMSLQNWKYSYLNSEKNELYDILTVDIFSCMRLYVKKRLYSHMLAAIYFCYVYFALFWDQTIILESWSLCLTVLCQTCKKRSLNLTSHQGGQGLTYIQPKFEFDGCNRLEDEIWGLRTGLEATYWFGDNLRCLGYHWFSFVQEQQDFGFDLAKLETQALRSGWKFMTFDTTHVDVSKNGGTQQPWVFILKMIILGCFGGTTIEGSPLVAKFITEAMNHHSIKPARCPPMVHGQQRSWWRNWWLWDQMPGTQGNTLGIHWGWMDILDYFVKYLVILSLILFFFHV